MIIQRRQADIQLLKQKHNTLFRERNNAEAAQNSAEERPARSSRLLRKNGYPVIDMEIASAPVSRPEVEVGQQQACLAKE